MNLNRVVTSAVCNSVPGLSIPVPIYKSSVAWDLTFQNSVKNSWKKHYKHAHTATNKASDKLADLNSKDAHTAIRSFKVMKQKQTYM